MKTYLDCIPCFFKQALQAGRLLDLDTKKTRTILNRISLLISQLSMADSPPAMSCMIFRIIREETGIADPYQAIKTESNRMALRAYPKLKNLVNNAADPLLKAVELSIAGNIIDFGANTDLDTENEIEKILKNTDSRIAREDHIFFQFDKFTRSLAGASSLLFLADNAGEIVFDRVLIETILALMPGIDITIAVRGTPVINDCTLEDAVTAGLDSLVKVISNGSDAPGTILGSCSAEFRNAWSAADLVISKGQGNYETTSDENHSIFYLLIAKCLVIAESIGCRKGDIILISTGK